MARVLMLTSRLPFPPREGHQLRSWHLLRALASRHEVTLLSFERADDAPDEAGPLREVLAGLETFPIAGERSRLAMARAVARGVLTPTPYLAARYDASALRARIAALAPSMDLVHVDMLPLAQHLGAVPAGIPVVLNAHNVEHKLLADRAALEQRPLVRAFLRGQVPRLHAFEQAACTRADLVLACSEADGAELSRMAPATPLAVVPNGVDLEANQPTATPPGEPPTMVFVGQMGWFPNRDGACWFLEEILPRVLASRPDARFVLVGRNDGLRPPAHLAGSVTLAGFVPDVRPWVQSASVYVVPLRAGSGTRLKVLEAMAMGKAIVTTSIGSEGIALEHGRDALFADDPAAMATAILQLLADPQRAAALGAQARFRAEERYGWDAIGRDLLLRYDALLAGAREARREAGGGVLSPVRADARASGTVPGPPVRAAPPAS